ncbi:hypothetical protein BC830DRAFT_1163823 [Chytriomyces sp. MP71]|nr:hypothetical protein BC830DRAFT_1163823 [Chytriomyces sp. MP71]
MNPLQRLAIAIDDVKRLQSHLSDILRDLTSEDNNVPGPASVSASRSTSQRSKYDNRDNGLRETAEDYLQVVDSQESPALVFSPTIKSVGKRSALFRSVTSYKLQSVPKIEKLPKIESNNDGSDRVLTPASPQATTSLHPKESVKSVKIHVTSIDYDFPPFLQSEPNSKQYTNSHTHSRRTMSVGSQMNSQKFAIQVSSEDSIPSSSVRKSSISGVEMVVEEAFSTSSSLEVRVSDESLATSTIQRVATSQKGRSALNYSLSARPSHEDTKVEALKPAFQISEPAIKSDGPPPPETCRQRRKTSTYLEKILMLDSFTRFCLIPAYDHKGHRVGTKILRETDIGNVSFIVNGIHPRSLFFNVWDLFMSVSMLGIVYTIPFVAAFNPDYDIVNMHALSACLTVLFAVDTAVSCVTPLVPIAATNNHNLAEYERVRPTLPDWLLTWTHESLFIHILTLIPFETMFHALSYSNFFLYLRLLRLWTQRHAFTRCPSLRGLAGFLDERAGASASQIAPIVVGMLFFIHLNACMMYSVGRVYAFEGWRVFWPLFDSASLFELYTWVFYKAVGNMFPTSFNPWSSGEQVASLIFIITGAIVYAIFLGAISSATLAINPSGRLYTQKIGELKDYIRWKNLSEETEAKLLEFYETKYHGKYFEEDSILTDMNDSLRAEVTLHNTQNLIKRVPFLQRAENDGRDEIFFGRIAMALHARHFIPGDFVLKQGDNAYDMYFILTGKVDVLVDGRRVVSLVDGAYFGEMALITTALRTASIQAVLPSEMYRLKRPDFHAILEDFRDVRARIEALAEERRLALKQK